MADTDLKALNNEELLAVALTQQQEIEQLKAQIVSLQEQLNDADHALEKQTEEKQLAKSILEDTNARCDLMEREAREKSEIIIKRAQDEADKYWKTVEKRLEEFYNEYQGLRELFDTHNRENLKEISEK